jgi:hypothetical protein
MEFIIMIKTFEEFINEDINVDILCEGEEYWWNKEMYNIIISYDGEIKNTYLNVGPYSLSQYVDEFVKYISILTLADTEELKRKNTDKRFIKGYTLKNPKRNKEWETCSIFLFKGGEPADTFKEYINTLQKQVKELGYEEEKKKRRK